MPQPARATRAGWGEYTNQIPAPSGRRAERVSDGAKAKNKGWGRSGRSLDEAPNRESGTAGIRCAIKS